MPQHSAGILLYRRRGRLIEVLLVHPGGPFWTNKDAGAWSIPKGGYQPGEDAYAAARREFEEETGARPAGEPVALGSFRQSAGKIVEAWAIEGTFDPDSLKSNTFAMEWPPRSGRIHQFPEVDRAAWFNPAVAERKILKGQRPILEALFKRLEEGRPTPREPRRSSGGAAGGK
jgi:predicted NUDIX family NTP pyrophosphohydrolase